MVGYSRMKSWIDSEPPGMLIIYRPIESFTYMYVVADTLGSITVMHVHIYFIYMNMQNTKFPKWFKKCFKKVEKLYIRT